MVKLSEEQEERAKRIHKEAIVVDGKGPSIACSAQYTPNMIEKLDELLQKDPPWERFHWEIERVHAEDMISGRSNMEREWMELGGIDVRGETVCWPKSYFALENALAGIAVWQRKIDAQDWLVKATKYADVVRAKAQGKKCVIIGFENTEHFRRDMDLLQWFYEMGIRRIQLTYNLQNEVGSGFLERADDGLSHWGIELLARLNKMKILVDLTHCGTGTTLDAIENSSSPVAVTHGFARGLASYPMGKTDEVLKKLAARNGYFGVNIMPMIVVDKSKRDCTLDDGLLAQIDYIAKKIGPDKVGVGTDYNGEYRENILRRMIEKSEAARKDEFKDIELSTVRIKDYRDQRDFMNVTRGLVAHGYNDSEIKGIIGGNFLRIFKEVCG